MVNLLDSSEQIKTFYLVRHGETNATEQGHICGQMDIGLTDYGIQQAEVIADWFYENSKIDSIFSSPLVRVVQTTDLIAKAIKMPTYYKHSGLLEKKEGAWDGKTYWQIRAESPALWEKWSKDPIDIAPPDGESVKSFVARVGRAFEDIRKNYQTGHKVILATHAGVIKAIIMHALNIPVQNFFRIDIPPGSISRVDWSDSFATLKFCGLCPYAQDLAMGA